MSINKETQFDSLTESIAEVMRERILKGEYKIGEKIKETHVAEELRVSRTPIRKAFKQLEQEGLIEYLPNRGCYAKGFTKRDIEDVYAIRKALEELTTEWAVARITDEDIAQMEEKCDEMQGYVNKGDSAPGYGKPLHVTGPEVIQTVYRTDHEADLLRAEIPAGDRRRTQSHRQSLRETRYRHSR